MMDKETRSLWDPVSGEAFDGSLKGRSLEIWPVFITTVGSELSTHPNTQLFFSTHQSPKKWILGLLSKPLMGINKHGFIPPFFYKSMSKPIDPRLPKLNQGLGVIVGKRAKYYPMDKIPRNKNISENWNGRTMTIHRSGYDGIPHAFWKDTGEFPMQLLSRWYGFAFSYPECEIYEGEYKKN
jgi:hypothetical protein